VRRVRLVRARSRRSAPARRLRARRARGASVGLVVDRRPRSVAVPRRLLAD
jgi:hypothetical protein